MHHTTTNKLMKLLAHLEGAYAPNTLRAYRADMLEFIAYCEKTGDCALPAAPSTVASFLMKLFLKESRPPPFVEKPHLSVRFTV